MTYYNTVRDKAVPIDFEVSRRLKSFLDNGVTCATKTFEIINDVNSRTENVASDKHSLLNVDCGFTSYLKYPTNDKTDDKEKNSDCFVDPTTTTMRMDEFGHYDYQTQKFELNALVMFYSQFLHSLLAARDIDCFQIKDASGTVAESRVENASSVHLTKQIHSLNKFHDNETPDDNETPVKWSEKWCEFSIAYDDNTWVSIKFFNPSFPTKQKYGDSSVFGFRVSVKHSGKLDRIMGETTT